MTAPRINALRSLRLWLPIFLMLTAGGGGAILYFTEASVHQTKFENEFKDDQILRTARLQSEVERWVQRNDPEMVESVFAEMGIVPELKTALFLNASNRVLAASRRADIGAPLEIQTLARDQQDQARLTDAMQTTRQTKRSQALFTSGRNRLVICQPTSVPLRAGELETAQAGLIVVSYDLTLDKAASLQHVQGEFLIYFASLLFIALLLGVSVHFLVTRRLEWLKARMGEFAAGQPLPGSPARLGDEITYLCDRFDEMATSVSREMAERQGAEAKIRRLNAELEDRVRQRTGQLETTLKEVESFAYSLSHDLRGPLRHIAGYSHILLEDAADKLDAEERKNLQSVRRAANRMAQLLDDLLSLLQVTRSQVHRSPTDLSALAAAVAGEFRQAQPERKVRVVIAPGLKVEADPQQLRIVLTHLLGNAWKFTSQQPAALIEVGVLEAADPPVYFIRDNGAGFDMAYAGKLFGAFQRLHKDTEFSGTGIGLAIAQRIIQRHDGRIWAESEAGKGATFYFTLPKADVPRETEPQLVAGIAQDISERKQAEQQLALLSFALNQVHEAAFLIDEKACFRFVNEEACRALGYTREELLKRGVPDVDPDFPKAQWDGHWKELRARHSMNFEGRHQTKSGRIFPVEVNANYLEYGGQAYNLALVRDITERKRSQEATAQEQARLKFIFDALPIGICLNRKQRDGSEIRLINDAHLRIAGIRREQDQMDTWLRISHPADRQRQAELNREIEEGKRQHFSMDKRYVQPDGRIVWVLFSLQRRKLDDGGIEDLTTVVDITERKQAEEKIGHLAAIVESTDDAVIGKTLDGKIVSWNRGAEQIYGYNAKEIIGQPVSVLIPPGRQAEFDDIMTRLKAGEKIQHFETLRIRKDGRIITVALTVCPIKDAGGKIVGASTIARDITERKQAAQRLVEAEAKYRCLVEESLVGVYLIQQGRFVYVNACMARAFGYRPEEVAGHLVEDFVAPEDRDRVTGNVVKREAGEVPSMHYGFHGLRKDGQIIDVEVLGTRTVYNDRPAVIGSLLDITERTRAEDALRRLNRELRAISDCNQILMRATDESALLKDICRIVCDEADYRMAWVGYAENDEAKTVRPVAWAGNEDGYLENARIVWSDTERGRGPTGQAIRTGQSAVSQSFESNHQVLRWRDEALKRGYRSSIALPLKDESGAVFGAFTIYSPQPNAFTPEEIRLLEELAGDLAFGITVLRGRIERKRAEDEIRKLNAELEQRVRDRTAALEREMDSRFRQQQFLEAVLESTDAGIVACDADGILTFFNRKSRELHGLPPTPIPAEQWAQHYDLFLPDGKTPMRKEDVPLFRALQGGRVVNEEMMIIPRGGEPKVLLANGQFIRDKEGRKIGAVVAMHDITERKRMEETLRASEEKYRNVVENIGLGVTMISPKMEILALNACMQKWFPHIDVRRRPICHESFINPPRDSLCVNCPTCQTLQDGQVHEGIIETPSGDKTLYFRVLSSPIRDKDGKVIAATEIVEDVTERKQAEEMLRASEERMRLFFERQLVGMAFTSPEKGWLKVNDRICEMLGYSREELTRLTWSEMTHPDDLAADVKQFERLLKDEIESYMLEKRFVRKDGSIVFTNLAVGCVRRADRSVDYVLAMLEDISDRKRAEADIRKLNEELQQRARELEAANQELQRMNKIFVGREIRMVELKEKLKALAKADTDNETNQTKGKI